MLAQPQPPWLPLLQALLWVAAVFFAPPAKAEPSSCRPAVEVEGEASIVSDVQKLLSLRGIASQPEGSCPAIIARIERQDTMFRLKIQDGYGRTSERFVAGAETAAILLESWACTDLSAPLLTARVLPEPVSPASEPASAPVEEPVREPPAVLPSPSPEEEPLPSLPPGPKKSLWGVEDGDRFPATTTLQSNLSAAMEISIGSNGSLGFGPRVSGCVLLGGICMGFIGRLSVEDEVTLPEITADSGYLSGEALFAIDFYTEPGALSITPGVGVGGGFVGVSRGTSTSGGVLIRETGALRADAHVLFAGPLTRWLDLDLGLSVGLASPSPGEIGGITEKSRLYTRGSLGLRWKP